MTAQDLIAEHDLELDDLRWYLALEQAERLLEYRDSPLDLAKLLWSGRLEADLYRMEDRFVESLEEKLSRGQYDEVEAHRILSSVVVAKEQRALRQTD